MQFYRDSIEILKDLSFSLSVSEYLEVHQSELDKLTSLMKDMKRNFWFIINKYTATNIQLIINITFD